MRRVGAVVFTFLFAVSLQAETAWVMRVNPAKNAVELQVVGAKINLLVQFPDLNALGLTQNGIAGFYFVCGEDESEKCDSSIPFKIQVNGVLGDLIAWKFLRPVEEILIGPGEPSSMITFLKGKIGDYHLLLALYNEDAEVLDQVRAKNNANGAAVLLPETDPHSAYLNQVLFKILVAAVSDPESK